MSSTYEGAFIAAELHENENLQLFATRKELIWDRLRRRWATKHQLKTNSYAIPNLLRVYPL